MSTVQEQIDHIEVAIQREIDPPKLHAHLARLGGLLARRAFEAGEKPLAVVVKTSAKLAVETDPGQARVLQATLAAATAAEGAKPPEPDDDDGDEDQKECPSCHAMNDEDAKRCDQCGKRLDGKDDGARAALPVAPSPKPRPAPEPTPTPKAEGPTIDPAYASLFDFSAVDLRPAEAIDLSRVEAISKGGAR